MSTVAGRGAPGRPWLWRRWLRGNQCGRCRRVPADHPPDAPQHRRAADQRRHLDEANAVRQADETGIQSSIAARSELNQRGVPEARNNHARRLTPTKPSATMALPATMYMSFSHRPAATRPWGHVGSPPCGRVVARAHHIPSLPPHNRADASSEGGQMLSSPRSRTYSGITTASPMNSIRSLSSGACSIGGRLSSERS